MNLDLNSNDSYCLNLKIRRIHIINTLIDDKSRSNDPYLKLNILNIKKNQNQH